MPVGAAMFQAFQESSAGRETSTMSRPLIAESMPSCCVSPILNGPSPCGRTRWAPPEAYGPTRAFWESCGLAPVRDIETWPENLAVLYVKHLSVDECR